MKDRIVSVLLLLPQAIFGLMVGSLIFRSAMLSSSVSSFLNRKEQGYQDVVPPQSQQTTPSITDFMQ